MPIEETTNSAPVESPSLQPSRDLNIPYDPDFDGEPSEANAEETEDGLDPEGEPDESAESAQESEESETVSEDDDKAEVDASPVEVNVPDDALVTLATGEKVKFSDLKKSPMLEKDYRHKTQELGNQRRALGEQATRIQNVSEALVNFLAQQIPEEPSYELTFTDPAKYMQQKAFRDAQVARIQGLLEQSTQAKAVTDTLTKEQQAEKLQAANEALLTELPELRDPAKRQKFNQQTWETARRFGYTAEELGQVADHRLLVLGHYAAMGLKAEQAQKAVVKKVQAAPTTPVKTASTKGDPKAFQNINAKRALAKTGSIRDAMKIDFE